MIIKRDFKLKETKALKEELTLAWNDGFKTGRDKAWKYAVMINDMTACALIAIFGGVSLWTQYSAEEAIKKIDDFMKHEKEKIEVGSEVYSELFDSKFIVTKINDDDFEGIRYDGACYESLPDDIRVTGKKADVLVALLRDMEK